jgi:hypothetical protein
LAYKANGDKENARKDLTYYMDNLEDDASKQNVQKLIDQLDATPTPYPAP